MILSDHQSGRRFDTPHRRAGKHHRRMEIGRQERRSAAEDARLGAIARRQFQRKCGHPRDVVLCPRRSGRYFRSRVEMQYKRIEKQKLLYIKLMSRFSLISRSIVKFKAYVSSHT